MRAIRAAVLTVRLAIDYPGIIERLRVVATAAAGTAAVLLAGFVAVAMGLN